MEVLTFDIFLSLLTLENLLAIVLGSLFGMIVGALPGLGATLAVVLLLPLTYSMGPLPGILMMLSAYQSAEYGGSISSIILGIPGTPAAAATVLDGYTYGKQHSPGKALAYSLTAGTIGGMFGGLVLIFLSVPLVKFALALGEPEYFLIAVLGLVAIVGFASKDIVKSLISVMLGLMAGTIGIDVLTALSRFTMGRLELQEGISMVALIIATFAFAAIYEMISDDINKKYVSEKKRLKIKVGLKEIKAVLKPIGLGSVIGSIVGIIPGMGAGPSSWFAYSAARGISKNPKTFGKGNPEGIVGPESANNATVGGALVPLLALGIPGSPVIAIILGAFIIHGIQPGPSLFSSESELVGGILFGFLLTTMAMFIVGKFVTSVFVRMLTIPNTILIPIIITLSLIGTFSARYLMFDIWLVLVIGIISFFAVKLSFSLPAFILAFVLSPIIEQSLRRTLILSDGSYAIFFTRVYSILLILITLVLVFFAIRGKWRERLAKVSKK